MFEKQVDKSHYSFVKYMSKSRWNSVWHQLDEIILANPKNVLEIGPGPGILKSAGAVFGLNIETLDIDPALRPDHVASVTAMPFAPSSFDVVCAFQMLEHLPFDQSLTAFREMVRVARLRVIISLPDSCPLWRYSIYIPRFGDRQFSIEKPNYKPRHHEFDGQHYWEINKIGFSLDKVIQLLSEFATLLKTYRVREMPYHRFFVFDCMEQNAVAVDNEKGAM
jgi:predicted SAM-dependent methyltransferase